MLARIASSLLCAGLLYFLWMAVFLLTMDVRGKFLEIVIWVLAPIVTGTGFAPPDYMNITLYEGGNWVGCPILTPKPTEAVFASIEGYYTKVQVYITETNEWKSYIPGLPPGLQDFTVVEPGLGYWVDVNDTTVTWEVNNSKKWFKPGPRISENQRRSIVTSLIISKMVIMKSI